MLRGAAALVRDRTDLRSDLASRLRPFDDLDVEGRLTELRRFRNEEVLRIGLHDVAGALNVEQVSRQLSDLADACVDACFTLATGEIEKRYGRRDAAMAVVALGKLGGRELGYHSDLDLLFLYAPADGPEPKAGEHGTNHEYFARIAQKLISHLTLPLREGFLYHIDTRLRPSGSAGPLVVSFDALAAYHAREARLWERQALLRARRVVGDEALFARAFAEVLQPSLFRPIDRAAAAKELLAMRERMEREIADESPGGTTRSWGGGASWTWSSRCSSSSWRTALPTRRSARRIRRRHSRCCSRTATSRRTTTPRLARGYLFLRRLESRLRIVRD